MEPMEVPPALGSTPGGASEGASSGWKYARHPWHAALSLCPRAGLQLVCIAQGEPTLKWSGIL